MKIESICSMIFLDIEISGKKVGRIVVNLFEQQAPKTCENFVNLGPRLEGTHFYRIIKNFMIQGGIQHNTYQNESTQQTEPFLVNENFDHDMESTFLLCTASLEESSSGFQFFITTAPTPHLKGNHTVFGQVKSGKSVVREIERVSTTLEHTPLDHEQPIIVRFGKWFEGDPAPVWNASYDQIAGDIYEEYPDDDTHIQRDSSSSVYKASLIIKESGVALLKKEDFINALLKFKKCSRYIMEFIPDEDQEPEYFVKFVTLKKKTYLNSSLCCLKMGDFSMCADYCTYLLDMSLSDQERAKTLYRLGRAMINGKRYKEAIVVLAQALESSNDVGIERELAQAQNLLQSQKDSEKSKYAKFFN